MPRTLSHGEDRARSLARSRGAHTSTLMRLTAV